MMKNETCQVIIESTQIAQKVFDTIQNKFESIQTMLESLMNRFTKIWVDSGKKEVKNWCWHHLNLLRLFVNRFSVNRFKKTVNRCNYMY